jgi:hypothetical protein
VEERHKRCRYWPHCSIHKGDPQYGTWTNGQRLFSEEAVADMREDRARGMTYPEIGQVWGTSGKFMWRLLNRTKRGI